MTADLAKVVRSIPVRGRARPNRGWGPEAHRRARHKRFGLPSRSQRRSFLYDVVLTVIATVVSFVLPFVVVPQRDAAFPGPPGIAGPRFALTVGVSMAASLTMIVRRRRPLIPAVLATVDLWLNGVGYLYPVGLYTLVVRGRWGWALFIGLAGALTPLVALALAPEPPPGLPPPPDFPLAVQVTNYLYNLLIPFVLAPGAVAVAVRAHRLRIEVMRDHAQRLVREEELSARNARLEERADIARDLHDVVAHYVGLIVMQAGALELRSLQSAPEVSGVASLIGDLGRRSMGELRDLLDVLRCDPDIQDRLSDDLVTAAWRQEVEDLVARTRQTGTAVTWELRGELSAAHDAANQVAFRAVQEGLSNALRHAPGAPADVRAEALADRLQVRVRNGPATRAHPNGPPPSGGYGLTGMRERIEAMGGTLLAEPTPEGGFQLSATIPTIGRPDDPRPARRRRDPGAPGDPADTRNR